ncbi:hypothetical protein PoB_003781500 [Plakobranchus ocellatus]|uniref:Uncharacterized protein n=1 Tax=Plakobranchus ocellatus TaxID=259542 RepID=A0AAV4AWU3_9GAST|nr:hypothetical protein PoB_003781500 [Plakobranchus ocellatus]
MELPNQRKRPKQVTFENMPDECREERAKCIQSPGESSATPEDLVHICPGKVFPKKILVNPCLYDSPATGSPLVPKQFVDCAESEKAPPIVPIQGKAPVAQKTGKVLCPQNVGKDTKGSSDKCPAHISIQEPSKDSKPKVCYTASPAQILTDKLAEMRVEEEFLRTNPVMRQQRFKYRGICGSLGNAVFSDTPVAPPEYQAKPPARRVPGYPTPVKQSPMYMTTSPQQGDLRLSGPPSGQGASGGARTCDRRAPADLRADSLATVPPTPPFPRITIILYIGR